MLIELAEERVMLATSASARMAGSEKMRFTAACASSKLPRMAMPCTLGADGVVIWSFWMREVPVCGKNTAISTPGTSAKPAIAAEPVSPEVAVRISTRLPCAAAVMKTGSTERATSLNAPVGPWKSSRILRPSASTSGTGSSAGNFARRLRIASSRTVSGTSSKSEPKAARSASASVAQSLPVGAGRALGTNNPPSGASPRRMASRDVAEQLERVLVNVIYFASSRTDL